MFVLGLVVGPAVGLTGGLFLFASGRVGARAIAGIAALAVLLIGVLPALTVELKVGLVLGVLLGILLALTPATPAHAPEATPEEA